MKYKSKTWIGDVILCAEKTDMKFWNQQDERYSSLKRFSSGTPKAAAIRRALFFVILRPQRAAPIVDTETVLVTLSSKIVMCCFAISLMIATLLRINFYIPFSLNENILFHQYNEIISFCQDLKRIFSLLFLMS